jgi:hypothetical protein
MQGSEGQQDLYTICSTRYTVSHKDSALGYGT